MSAGTFIYPPVNKSLTFGINDTLDVSWESYVTNSTPCALSTWTWSSVVSDDPWKEVNWQFVPCNGTYPIVLSEAYDSNNYLAQLNFNYTSVSEGDIKYLSEIFNVDNNPSVEEPRTWSAEPQSTTTTSTTSLASSTATSTSSLSSSTATTTSSTTTSAASVTTPVDSTSSTAIATTSQQKQSTGTIVGVTVGAVVGVLLLLCAAYVLYNRYRRRRKENAVNDLYAKSPLSPPYPQKYYPELEHRAYPVELPTTATKKPIGFPAELAPGDGRER